MQEIINSTKLNLNPQQMEVVINTEGPFLILAGAGTGKTKALTSRIAHILEKGILPEEIMAVTFTNKAAKEIEERVRGMVGINIKSMFMGTFHSVCARFLRVHGNLLGISSSFSIVDKDEQNKILKRILQERQIDERTLSVKNIINLISHWKNRGLMSENINISCIPYTISVEAGELMIEIYKEYQESLAALNALDFGDLLLYTLELFMKNEDILKKYQKRIKYIMVDEYQDTNVSQYLLIRILARAHQNICCVGDDDQSIYSWRGAEVANILKFEKDFPNAKVICMEQNYRSTPHILSAASSLISNNKNRLNKKLWTAHNEGDKVKIVSVWDDNEEANYISNTVMEAEQNQHDFPSLTIGVLVRASFQTRAIEESFINHKISYRIIAGTRFYERSEIKDAIAYLRVTINEDDGLAFERIINNPKRGIGPQTLSEIRNKAREWNSTLIKTAKKMLEENLFKNKVSLSLKEFFTNTEHWKKGSLEYPPAELMNIITNQSGYMEMLQNEGSDESLAKTENLKELIKVMEQYETAEEFLEHISLVMDKEDSETKNTVSIMTLHSAKGLEFDIVFLPGWEEEIFPNQKAIEEKSEKGLEEERRLAYVGITRGKKQVFISYTNNRRMYGRYRNSIASRFISELPHRNIEKISPFSNISQAPEYKNYFKNFCGGNEKNSSSASKPNSNYSIGERIFHIKFGYGKVIGIEQEKLKISFEKSDVKTIMDRFIEKTDNIPDF